MAQRITDQLGPPPNYSLQQHVTNGLSSRPSIAQVLSYIVIAFSICVYFSCTLSIRMNIVILVLYVVLALIMIISSAVATVCDPTDRVVYHYKWSRHDKKISFVPDYTKVLYCEYCDSYCLADSKHCRACNRCVNKFDHHCIWLNNCVGERNYNYFMTSIVSAFAYTVVVVIHVILVSFSTDFTDQTELAKIILSWILGVVLGVFGFMLFNLIVLHIYLIVTQQSTYTFLQRKKREEEQERGGKQKLEMSRNSMREPEGKSHHKIVYINSGQLPDILDMLPKNTKDDSTTVVKVRERSSAVSSSFIFDSKQSQGNIEQVQAVQQQKEQQQNEENKGQGSFSRQQEQGDNTVVRGDNSIIQQLKSDESAGRLPSFLRKNRSLNLLLAGVEVEFPTRRRLQTIK